jgi:hypothetical protein
MTMNEIALMVGYMVIAGLTGLAIAAVPLCGWALCWHLSRRVPKSAQPGNG